MRGLVRLKMATELFGLGNGHHPDRGVVAVLAVVSDRAFGKPSHLFLILYMSFIFHI
jgi:hypothetical protein